MIEVLPTPWSPRKTSLYFARGEIFGAPEPAAVVPADVASVDSIAAISHVIDVAIILLWSVDVILIIFEVKLTQFFYL